MDVDNTKTDEIMENTVDKTLGNIEQDTDKSTEDNNTKEAKTFKEKGEHENTDENHRGQCVENTVKSDETSPKKHIENLTKDSKGTAVNLDASTKFVPLVANEECSTHDEENEAMEVDEKVSKPNIQEPNQDEERGNSQLKEEHDKEPGENTSASHTKAIDDMKPEHGPEAGIQRNETKVEVADEGEAPQLDTVVKSDKVCTYKLKVNIEPGRLLLFSWQTL